MTQEPNDFVAEAKEQVATHICEGSHHNHDLIVGLLTEVERLTRERDEAWAERDPYIESNVKLVAEIKRLSIELADWQASSEAYRLYVERWKSESQRLLKQVADLAFANGRLREIGNASFMAMCAFRDSNDEESFQDAIDALGAALKGQAMTGEESECWASAQRWHEKYLKAEAEIERLKAGWETAFAIGVSEQEQNKKMRTEIARLKAEYETAFNVGYEEAKEGCVAEVERLRVQIRDDCTSHNQMLENWSIERQELRVEIERLRTEKTEMADAILQIDGLSAAHFRTLVSFEIAEFIFTERTAVRLFR